jgi:hypothetical protein
MTISLQHAHKPMRSSTLLAVSISSLMHDMVVITRSAVVQLIGLPSLHKSDTSLTAHKKQLQPPGDCATPIS